jgi:hypothetical protein
MKKFLVATAFAALLASPALAQTPNGGFKWPAASNVGSQTDHARSAQASARVSRNAPAERPQYVTTPTGQYTGADPDGRVRMQLQLDGVD